MSRVNVAVITVSDRSFRKEREDLSGPAIRDFLSSIGWLVNFTSVVNDDLSMIEEVLKIAIKREDIDLILTTGGTGLSSRDNTPEATLNVIEKSVPGLTEYMRTSGAVQNLKAILSRAQAGVAKGKLILNLPGSPKGAVESLISVASVIPHAIGILKDQEMHGE